MKNPEEMTIKVSDYFSKSEIEEMINKEIRKVIREEIGGKRKIKQQMNEISHSLVTEKINEILPNYEEAITKRIEELVSNLGKFDIFKDRDFYGKDKSVGQRILDNAVLEHKDLLVQGVEKAIGKFNEEDALFFIGDSIEKTVESILKKEGK